MTQHNTNTNTKFVAVELSEDQLARVTAGAAGGVAVPPVVPPGSANWRMWPL